MAVKDENIDRAVGKLFSLLNFGYNDEVVSWCYRLKTKGNNSSFPTIKCDFVRRSWFIRRSKKYLEITNNELDFNFEREVPKITKYSLMIL